MKLGALLDHHEAELNTLLRTLEDGREVDLSSMALGWKDLLEQLKNHSLSEEEMACFERIHTQFKKIEDLITVKMTELVLARSFAGGMR